MFIIITIILLLYYYYITVNYRLVVLLKRRREEGSRGYEGALGCLTQSILGKSKLRDSGETSPLLPGTLRGENYIRITHFLYIEMPYKDKEVNRQYMRQYRQDHKEEIELQKNKKTECGCGGHYLEKHKARHKRTLMHQNWVQGQT